MMRGWRRAATAHTDGPTHLLKPDRPRGIDRHIDSFGSASSRHRFHDWAGTLLGERRSFVLRGRSARDVDPLCLADSGGGCERWGASCNRCC